MGRACAALVATLPSPGWLGPLAPGRRHLHGVAWNGKGPARFVLRAGGPRVGQRLRILRAGPSPQLEPLPVSSSSSSDLPSRGCSTSRPRGPYEDRGRDMTSPKGLLRVRLTSAVWTSKDRPEKRVGSSSPRREDRRWRDAGRGLTRVHIHVQVCVRACTGVYAGACVGTCVPGCERTGVPGREETGQGSTPAPELCFFVAPPVRAWLWRWAQRETLWAFSPHPFLWPVGQTPRGCVMHRMAAPSS